MISSPTKLCSSGDDEQTEELCMESVSNILRKVTGDILLPDRSEETEFIVIVDRSLLFAACMRSCSLTSGMSMGRVAILVRVCPPEEGLLVHLVL